MDVYAEALAAARQALTQLTQGELRRLEGNRSTVPVIGAPWLDLLTLWSADTDETEKVEAARRLAHGQFSLGSLYPPQMRPAVAAAVGRWDGRGGGTPFRQAWEDLTLGPLLVAAEAARDQSYPYWLGVNTALDAWRLAPDDATMTLGEALASMRREVRRAVEQELGIATPTPDLPAPLPTVELWDMAAALEAQEQWQAVLAACSPQQRAILEAALALGEPDWAAVAQQLGLAEATVRAQVARLRKKVRVARAM